MMQKEFEELTGIYVTSALYAQKAADVSAIETKKLIAGQRDQIVELRSAVARLTRDLEIEQGWKPYQDEKNVPQEYYDKLRMDSTTKAMTDTEAKDWLQDEFGLDPARVTIIHEVDEMQVNRHGQIRRTGRKIERTPYYNATDWYYIRFDAGQFRWEASGRSYMTPYVG